MTEETEEFYTSYDVEMAIKGSKLINAFGGYENDEFRIGQKQEKFKQSLNAALPRKKLPFLEPLPDYGEKLI